MYKIKKTPPKTAAVIIPVKIPSSIIDSILSDSLQVKNISKKQTTD